MYHYLNDKATVKRMRHVAGNLLQTLCRYLKEDFDISARFYLVGSGAKNLILQNEDEPVDLDYNLEIVKCRDFTDCKYIKECVRKAFNKTLRQSGLWDCEDSTSTLTSKKMFWNGKKIVSWLPNTLTICYTYTNLSPWGLGSYKDDVIPFSIDICITQKGKSGSIHRLIHEKNGSSIDDKYYWNIAPNTKRLKEKVDYIKSRGKWHLVRRQYLAIKNRYHQRNDTNHSSFICYAEAVNNVYNERNNW